MQSSASSRRETGRSPPRAWAVNQDDRTTARLRMTGLARAASTDRWATSFIVYVHERGL